MKISAPGLSLELQVRRVADDEDWCRVQVLARVNGFRSEFEAWLQSGDLERFTTELGSLQENIGQPGKASLQSAEPEIEVVLTMHSLGGIAGKYRFESERRNGTPTVLSGAFEIDQSYLPSITSSVENLLSQLRGRNVP